VIFTAGWSASNEAAAACNQALDGSVKLIRLREPLRGGEVVVGVVLVEVVDGPDVEA
jgi:hypothetical protein